MPGKSLFSRSFPKYLCSNKLKNFIGHQFDDVDNPGSTNFRTEDYLHYAILYSFFIPELHSLAYFQA